MLRRWLSQPRAAPLVLRRRLAASTANASGRTREAVAHRLFTPGPLNTSAATRAAMRADVGSRQPEMIEAIAYTRRALLEMAHVSPADGYECVLQPGTGTFCIESVIGSVLPREGGRLLVLANGAYGERIGTIAARLEIPHDVVASDERHAISPDAVRSELAGRSYTHVAAVHHETTCGVLNPIAEIGAVMREAAPDASFIVDSMSAFGAYDVDMRAANIHYLVSSANKAIEGVPGFAFCLCERQRLLREGSAARSISLDLLEQWRALEENGQFRFTAPTHALLAFEQALRQHEAEGGHAGRLRRYEANCCVLMDGMRALGFEPYVADAERGSIITTYACPDDSAFSFETFYADLAARGLIIYPGKVAHAECFRVGTIGQLQEADVVELVEAIRDVLAARGVRLPVTQVAA